MMTVSKFKKKAQLDEQLVRWSMPRTDRRDPPPAAVKRNGRLIASRGNTRLVAPLTYTLSEVAC